MIVNEKYNIKNFYRFIEFTSKLLKVDLPHERFKLIVLDQYLAETEKEKKVKAFSESYLYLLNNVNQCLNIEILIKAYYLLTNRIIEKSLAEKVVKYYYQLYDESSHYLAALMHFKILEEFQERKIEFAFMLSNYVMYKKKRYPLIPFEFMFNSYYEAIKKIDINKLLYIFAQMEAVRVSKTNYEKITLEEIIRLISEKKGSIKNKYEVKKLYLYGSYAKEKTTENSDLDFLIIFNDDIVNIERNKQTEELIKYLTNLLKVQVDLIDFSHALEKLDIIEMEKLITLI